MVKVVDAAPKAKHTIEYTKHSECAFMFPMNVRIETDAAPFRKNSVLIPSRAYFIPSPQCHLASSDMIRSSRSGSPKLDIVSKFGVSHDHPWVDQRHPAKLKIPGVPRCNRRHPVSPSRRRDHRVCRRHWPSDRSAAPDREGHVRNGPVATTPFSARKAPAGVSATNPSRNAVTETPHRTGASINAAYAFKYAAISAPVAYPSGLSDTNGKAGSRANAFGVWKCSPSHRSDRQRSATRRPRAWPTTLPGVASHPTRTDRWRNRQCPTYPPNN
jgi:hypothetical protein